jgi:tetratricopeptide (TPR) repeat protein
MAFGLGFNKAKSLAAAEKYVMQGKVPAAIQEYQKILEQEPRDLVILNTVGDLHLRINKTAEALVYFYKLGEAYVEDGFVRNGIAVFKKITRSDPNAIEAISRLADLYTVQGQLSEARNYLNQAVDFYNQRGEPGKCVELFEKLLLMDPENATAKQRLAVAYEQAGKKEDAAGMYFSAAEALADRANPVEAEKALRKARELGVANDELLVLEARIQIDSGRGAEAIATLAQIPDHDSNRAALNLLYHAHISTGDLAASGAVAASIFDKFDDFAGVEQVAAMMIERGDTGQALTLYESVVTRAVEQRSTQPLADGVKSILQQDKDNVRARRLLCRVYEGTGETGEFTDASEQLAEILSQRQDYESARAIYAKLAEMEPANPMHKQRMRQMDQKLGRSSSETLSADAPALSADLSEASTPASGAPAATEALDPGIQQIVSGALDASDQQAVFMQYDEAIATLQQALTQVPGNTSLNQKLVDVYELAERWSEAAATSEALTETFVMAGDGDNATRYGDLMAKFQALAAGGASAEPAMPETAPVDDMPGFPGMEEFTVPDAAPMGIPEMDLPASAPEDTITLPPEFTTETADANETHEVDLSSEWEAMMVVDGAPVETAPEPPEMIVPETIVPEMEAPAPQGGEAQEFSMEEMTLEPEPAPTESLTIPAFEEPPAFTEPQAFAEPQALTEPQALEEPPPPPPPVVHPPVVHQEEDFTLDLGHEEPATAQEHDPFELSLDLDEVPAAPPAPVPAPVPAPAPAPAAPVAASPMGLDDLVGALDDGSAILAPPSKPPARPPAAKPVEKAAPKPAAGKPKGGEGLADVFAEFKEEMEQDSAVESDIENHFNMGVAFKEMGLYDEAIGEFQKAYHGAEHLPSNPNFIPVCTLLAHCFMEKSLPELAVKWLETALKAPGLDREGEMALRYEIGSSQETAGQRPAALASFMQVYSMNIDYRDVADRIRSLKGN